MTDELTIALVAEPKAEKSSRRVDIASVRREQIIEAAVGIIVTRGLQNLSLSRIEDKTGMKRGQLTYYFPAKEDILLAVFDRLLQRMIGRMHEDHDISDKHGIPPAWDMTRRMMNKVLHRDEADNPLRTLEHTFLAQLEYRDDFRRKLAGHYEEWRSAMAVHWNLSAKPSAKFAGTNPRIVASFMQAVVHGLNVLMTADPNAFDREEMLSFCIEMLSPLFQREIDSACDLTITPLANGVSDDDR